MDPGGEPARSAGEPAVQVVVKALNEHFQRLEPPLDLVTIGVFELTAQVGSCESGQVVEAVD